MYSESDYLNCTAAFVGPSNFSNALMHNKKLASALNATMALPSKTGSPLTKLKMLKLNKIDPLNATSIFKSRKGKSSLNSSNQPTPVNHLLKRPQFTSIARELR